MGSGSSSCYYAFIEGVVIHDQCHIIFVSITALYIHTVKNLGNIFQHFAQRWVNSQPDHLRGNIFIIVPYFAKQLVKIFPTSGLP